MIHAIKRAKGYIYGSKHHLDYALETFELFLEKKKNDFFSLPLDLNKQIIRSYCSQCGHWTTTKALRIWPGL